MLLAQARVGMAAMRTATDHPATLHAARRSLRHRAVEDAMLRQPTLSKADTTVDELVDFFVDDHRHAAIIVDGRGRLLSIVERADLQNAASGDQPGRTIGSVAGRTVEPSADLLRTWETMRAHGRRRLAVTDENGALLGLLAMKRTGLGFCTDAGVESLRAARRAAGPTGA